MKLEEIFGPGYRDHPAYVKAEKRIRDYGLKIAVMYNHADDFLTLTGDARQPPTTWSFVPKLEAKEAANTVRQREQITMSDLESADLRSFFIWYLPVESAMLRLCQLLIDAHQAGPDHCELRDQLVVVAEQYRGIYADWLDGGRIRWLPERFPDNVKGERMNIVEFMKKTIARHGYRAAEPDPPLEGIPF